MRRLLMSAAVVSAALLSACGPTVAEPSVGTTPVSGVSTWTLGDSQGALSNDPARGLPWTERLGPAVGNGAAGMHGAGWTVAGTNSALTVPQRAQALAAANTVTRYVVMAGVNDLWSKTTAQMLAGVDQLEAVAAAEGATVIYVGIVPVPQNATIAARNGQRLAFNAALAQRFGTRYRSCDAAMSTPSGWLQPSMSLGPQDLHLNDAGEQALANCVAAVL